MENRKFTEESGGYMFADYVLIQLIYKYIKPENIPKVLFIRFKRETKNINTEYQI